MSGSTPKLIKQLREMTGAGMLDCKNALNETDGDLTKAVQALREAGLSKAAKKAGNVASEGLITILVAEDFKKVTMTEVNAQTDFVAKNANFINLTKEITSHVQNFSCKTSEELNETTINGQNFVEFLNEKISTIGENIVARKMATIEAKNGVVNGYVHANGKVGVILAAKCSDDAKEKTIKLLKNLSMHASAMKPSVISFEDLDAKFIEDETRAIKAEIQAQNDELKRLSKPLKKIPEFVSMSQITSEVLENAKQTMQDELKKQGKPEKIWDKIIPGQVQRFIEDNTQLDQRMALLSQAYVMNDKISVKEAIKEVDASIELVEYVRFELGEGIEKKEEDFAAEVAKQMAK